MDSVSESFKYRISILDHPNRLLHQHHPTIALHHDSPGPNHLAHHCDPIHRLKREFIKSKICKLKNSEKPSTNGIFAQRFKKILRKTYRIHHHQVHPIRHFAMEVHPSHLHHLHPILKKGWTDYLNILYQLRLI